MHVSKCRFKVQRLLNKLGYGVHDNILSCGCHGNISLLLVLPLCCRVKRGTRQYCMDSMLCEHVGCHNSSVSGSPNDAIIFFSLAGTVNSMWWST